MKPTLSDAQDHLLEMSEYVFNPFAFAFKFQEDEEAKDAWVELKGDMDKFCCLRLMKVARIDQGKNIINHIEYAPTEYRIWITSRMMIGGEVISYALQRKDSRIDYASNDVREWQDIKEADSAGEAIQSLITHVTENEVGKLISEYESDKSQVEAEAAYQSYLR